MNRNCTINGVLRKKSVYTFAIVFSGLTLHGLKFNDLILILENFPLLLKNSNPRKVNAIPRRILAKDTGAPIGRKMYSIPSRPRPCVPGMADLNIYRPAMRIGAPATLTCVGSNRSTRFFSDVGEVLHIARVTPRKNPRTIPKETILIVAMKPSLNLSLVSSTNTPKLLYSGTAKPT